MCHQIPLLSLVPACRDLIRLGKTPRQQEAPYLDYSTHGEPPWPALSLQSAGTSIVRDGQHLALLASPMKISLLRDPGKQKPECTEEPECQIVFPQGQYKAKSGIWIAVDVDC